MNKTPLIALYRGSSALSKAIQWQTDSPYSHAAVYFPNTNEVIEADAVKGVRKAKFASREGVEFYAVEGVNWGEVYRFLSGEIGAPYDYGGIVRFISRLKGASNKSWFCSELVFEAIQRGGVNLLDRIEPYQVSPGKLATSPLLLPA